MMVKSWFYHVVEFFKDLPNSFVFIRFFSMPKNISKTGWVFFFYQNSHLLETVNIPVKKHQTFFQRTSLPTPGISMFQCFNVWLVVGWVGDLLLLPYRWCTNPKLQPAFSGWVMMVCEWMSYMLDVRFWNTWNASMEIVEIVMFGQHFQ